MIIVDDHLALLALAGRLPDLSGEGPIVTTWSFHYRMAKAVLDASRSGSLSRRFAEQPAATRRVLHPPAHRLIVLDPRVSVQESVRIAVARSANLLLAELAGNAVHHAAAVRVTPPNVGRRWPEIMAAEGVDFAAVQV